MKLCTGCRRHVRLRDASCPFCGTGLRSGGAVVLGAAVLLGGACADRPVDVTSSGSSTDAPAGSSSEAGSSESGGFITPTTTATATATATVPETTQGPGDGSSSDTGDVGGSFYGAPVDAGPDPFECNPFVQDCPRGQKCAPYAMNETGQWDALKCVPVMEDPDAPGEACVAEPGTTGIDSCDVGGLCWDTDDAGNGKCIALCGGQWDAPVCADAGTTCGQYNDGALNICVSTCDPLMPACAADEVCAFNTGGEDSFVCLFDASGEEGQVDDPCGFVNACDVGLACVVSTSAMECDQAEIGCCQPFCDTSVMDPDSQCSGMGQVCMAYFDDPPMGLENVGVCAVMM